MTLSENLQPVINEIGRENIWRPVIASDNTLLFEGVGTHRDHLDKTLEQDVFTNRTVMDLGCNLGYYSFLTARLGARRVLGLDINPAMIKGCHILKKHYQLDNAHFMVANFAENCSGERAEIGLLLDFIGKNVILKEKLYPILHNLKNLISSELHLSLHPEYDIERIFKMDGNDFSRLYPAEFINKNRFFLLDYVLSILDNDWQLSSTIPEKHKANNLKYPLYFKRK